MVAYYARNEICRSCRDAHSVTMAIWVTEYLMMACNRWYEEACDGRVWLFSDALFGWVEQLKPEDLAGDDAEALGFFQAMLALRAARPVQDQAFHNAVRCLDTSRRDRDGWLTVVTGQDSDDVVPLSGGLPQEEGGNGCLGRSRDTRYGTRGPGSRGD